MSRLTAEERTHELRSVLAELVPTPIECLVLDLADDLTEAVAMLREVQYCGETGKCPSCRAWNSDGCGKDCRLAALLAKHPEGS